MEKKWSGFKVHVGQMKRHVTQRAATGHRPTATDLPPGVENGGALYLSLTAAIQYSRGYFFIKLFF